MLRLDTQFNIRGLTNRRLFKIVTLQELIEKGLDNCAGNTVFEDFMLWVDRVDSAIVHQLVTLLSVDFSWQMTH